MAFPLLSLLIFIPLAGVFFLSLVKPDDHQNAKAVALWVSSLNFFFACVIWYLFDAQQVGYQFIEKHKWISSFSIHYHIGIDAISLYFVLLSAFLTPLAILSSFKSIQKRVREYLMAFLLLETFMIGVFCAIDTFLFYVFFEGVLIPMFLIIGIWGGENRLYACFKFFLYTFAGSIFMLLALIFIYNETGSTNLIDLYSFGIKSQYQTYLFWAFMFAFAVKIPMWPFHTWLPDAHVEAPTAGSVLLAGVLLKMGGYGMLRFVLPLFPLASQEFSSIICILSIIAIVYASLIALVQDDVKKVIAYSSIAHMGFVTLGLFTFSLQGVSGAVVQMISHGLVSAALFLCVGIIYDRYHTRVISFYSGLITIMPVYATLFFLFMLASIGLPGTSGFVGEFLVFISTFKVSPMYVFFAGIGIVLGAAYMLWLYKRMFMGKPSSHLLAIKQERDLSFVESSILCVILILVLGLGVYPNPIVKSIKQVIPHLIRITN